MTVSKKLVLIATLCTTIPSAILCMENNPKPSTNDFTQQLIEFKNKANKEFYEPMIKPYIGKPEGLASACIISSLVGPKITIGFVILGMGIATANKHIKNAERKALTNENQ